MYKNISHNATHRICAGPPLSFSIATETSPNRCPSHPDLVNPHPPPLIDLVLHRRRRDASIILRYIDVILQDLCRDLGARPRHMAMLLDGETIVEIVRARDLALRPQQRVALASVDLVVHLVEGLGEERVVDGGDTDASAGVGEVNPLGGTFAAPVYLDGSGGEVGFGAFVYQAGRGVRVSGTRVGGEWG